MKNNRLSMDLDALKTCRAGMTDDEFFQFLTKFQMGASTDEAAEYIKEFLSSDEKYIKQIAQDMGFGIVQSPKTTKQSKSRKKAKASRKARKRGRK